MGIRKKLVSMGLIASMAVCMNAAVPVQKAEAADWVEGALKILIGAAGASSSSGSSSSSSSSSNINAVMLAQQKHYVTNPNQQEKLFVLAVKKNDIETAKQMIDAGVDVDGVYKDFWTSYYASTALMYATHDDNRDMMQMLLENGANPNGYYDSHNNFHSYLIEACDHGSRLEQIQYLHAWGASIGIKGCERNADEVLDVIHAAVCYSWQGDAESAAMVQYFADNGANLEFRNSKHFNGNTPFMCAVDRKKYQTMRVLAEKGANLYAINGIGKSALDIALDKNDLQLYKYVQDLQTRKR